LCNIKVTYMQTEIKHSWFYAAPPETIWAYLTQAELLTQWVMPNDIKPKVGHHFMFNTKAIPEMEFDGKVFCEIMEIVPLKKLSYSWKAGSGDGRMNLETLVTWTLISKNKGTELLLEHTGFDESVNKVIFQAMHAGWNQNMGKIEKLTNKEKADEAAPRI
jgi:uncharacterized protein YndB with AHSA1/START domain